MLPEEEALRRDQRHRRAEPPHAGTPRRGRASPPHPRDTFPVSSALAHPSGPPVPPTAPLRHRDPPVPPKPLGATDPVGAPENRPPAAKRARAARAHSAPCFLAEGRFAAGHRARSPRRAAGRGDGDLQPGHVPAVGLPEPPGTGGAGIEPVRPVPASSSPHPPCRMAAIPPPPSQWLSRASQDPPQKPTAVPP